MSVQGRWRVVDTPGYDMAVPTAYILLDHDGGEFAFDCLTGSIHGACDGDAIQFTWDGNDERPAATVGPSCRTTAPSKVRSASKTAMTYPSSLAARPLLQQPANPKLLMWGPLPTLNTNTISCLER